MANFCRRVLLSYTYAETSVEIKRVHYFVGVGIVLLNQVGWDYCEVEDRVCYGSVVYVKRYVVRGPHVNWGLEIMLLDRLLL